MTKSAKRIIAKVRLERWKRIRHASTAVGTLLKVTQPDQERPKKDYNAVSKPVRIPTEAANWLAALASAVQLDKSAIVERAVYDLRAKLLMKAGKVEFLKWASEKRPYATTEAKKQMLLDLGKIGKDGDV